MDASPEERAVKKERETAVDAQAAKKERETVAVEASPEAAKKERETVSANASPEEKASMEEKGTQTMRRECKLKAPPVEDEEGEEEEETWEAPTHRSLARGRCCRRVS